MTELKSASKWEEQNVRLKVGLLPLQHSTLVFILAVSGNSKEGLDIQFSKCRLGTEMDLEKQPPMTLKFL